MMTVPTRLKISALMVLLSIMYAIIVATVSPELAMAIGIGYICIMGTGLVATNVWKHHDR